MIFLSPDRLEHGKAIMETRIGKMDPHILNTVYCHCCHTLLMKDSSDPPVRRQSLTLLSAQHTHSVMYCILLTVSKEYKIAL